MAVKRHDEDCSRTFRVEYLKNEKGSVEIMFCSTCGAPEHAKCEHEKNTWNVEETELTCDLCGADAT